MNYKLAHTHKTENTYESLVWREIISYNPQINPDFYSVPTH